MVESEALGTFEGGKKFEISIHIRSLFAHLPCARCGLFSGGCRMGGVERDSLPSVRATSSDTLDHSVTSSVNPKRASDGTWTF